MLRQENAAKVNTTLEREYSIVKNDDEVLELKTFNTENKPILQTTDVTQWFIENVQAAPTKILGISGKRFRMDAASIV